jgi:hypothetical protein
MSQRVLLVCGVLAALAVLVGARTARAEPGDEYTVSVITMSPGDPVFFKFGHIALLVRDGRTHRADVYNWGTFSFEERGLVTKFLRGRLTYWLSRQGLRGTVEHYGAENRWVLEQQLALSPAQKLDLVARVLDNYRPENRTYRYHYYRDNCSTRVRDVVDAALGGRLRAVSGAPARMTYRGQTSRLTADTWWAYVFLNLAMGSFIDQPVQEWDEMFVPSKVAEILRRVTVPGPTGQPVPLVRSERLLVGANRAPELAEPPRRKLALASFGALLGAGLGLLAHRLLASARAGGMTPLGRRVALALALGALGLLVGFLGLLFLFFWTLTDHEVAWHNENLLQTSPIAVALPVIAVGLLRDRAWARLGLERLAYALAAMSALGLALKAMPWWFEQVNGEMIALALPTWLGLAAGCFLVRRGVGLRAAGAPREARSGG